MTKDTMSFEEALRASEELLQDFEDSGPSTELLVKLSSMLSAVPSCRGFFVLYLTGESPLADEPPEYILQALNASEHVPELLAKNLVMSITMQIVHERKGNKDNANASALVAKRSTVLIERLKSPLVRTKLIEMRSSIRAKAGVFADFLQRWSYDEEQLEAANKAIESLV